MSAKIHAIGGPGVEVIAGGDGTAHALLLTHAPVLVEGAAVARDAWRVHSLRAVHVVGAAVGVHRTHEPLATGWSICAPAVDDVVLDQWIRGPSVQRQVRVAVGIEAAG